MTWEWSDLRYFLAVARSGSTSAAARLLGVNQTTCARRIEVLERALGLILFERTSAGYPITPAGAALMSEAERAEQGAIAFERLAVEQARAIHSVVRLTAGDFLAELIAVPAIAALAKTTPELRVELDISSKVVDLACGDADVALRAALAIKEPDLVARKIMATPWAFYCSNGYAAQTGAPRTMSEAMAHPLVTLAGTPAEMLRSLHPAADIRHTTNSMTALVSALCGGHGVGALPVIVGDRQPGLTRCFDVPIGNTGGIWIVYHERLRHAPQVRILVDHLARFASNALVDRGMNVREVSVRSR